MWFDWKTTKQQKHQQQQFGSRRSLLDESSRREAITIVDISPSTSRNGRELAAGSMFRWYVGINRMLSARGAVCLVSQVAHHTDSAACTEEEEEEVLDCL